MVTELLLGRNNFMARYTDEERLAFIREDLYRILTGLDAQVDGLFKDLKESGVGTHIHGSVDTIVNSALGLERIVGRLVEYRDSTLE